MNLVQCLLIVLSIQQLKAKQFSKEIKKGDQISKEMEKETSVVIIGAGFTGLAAAKYLKDNGVDVVILEARDRIGGRTLTIDENIAKDIDLGGSYIGVSQKRIPEFCKKFGIELKSTVEVGDFVFYTKGKGRPFKSAFPPMKSILGYLDVRNVFRTIQSIASEIPPDAPWEAKDAEELDKVTLKQFLDKTVWTREASDYVKSLFQAILVAEPHECSLLWILWRFTKMYWRPDRLPSFETGHKKLKFVKGSRQLSTALMESIGQDKILTGHAACNIKQDDDTVIVTTVNQGTIQGDYVILTVPMALQNRITFEPALPSLRQQLGQHIPSAPVITVVVFYGTAFWKNKGFSGSIVADKDSLLSFTRNEDYGDVYALKGYVTGDKVYRYSKMSKDQRKNEVLQFFKSAFDTDEALQPLKFVDFDWVEDQWCSGGYTVKPPPGYLTKFAPNITEPFRRIHFANSETGTLWHSTMEGALLEGERAAKEILVRMGIKQEVQEVKKSANKAPVAPLYTTLWMRCLPSVPVFLVGTTSLATAFSFGFYFVTKLCR